jgi:hypothetical protein
MGRGTGEKTHGAGERGARHHPEQRKHESSPDLSEKPGMLLHNMR